MGVHNQWPFSRTVPYFASQSRSFIERKITTLEVQFHTQE